MSGLNFILIPEISIILPTYNRAKYLSDCINSAIAQTFPNWELIIVDDGSNDNTFEIVEPFVQKFDNIRYLKHKNRKPGYSRNAGIQASFGNYITFLDSDDQYKPEHLQSRLEYMKSHPEIDLIEGGLYSEDEELFVPDYFQRDKLISIKYCVFGATFFGKRHVFFDLKGFNNLDFGEDTDFWYRAEKRFKTQKLTEPKTYIYTRAETSITKDFVNK